MAHFAKLDEGNVIPEVLVVDNSVLSGNTDAEREQSGIAFLRSIFGEDTNWRQASYNTKAGIYYDPITNEPSADQSKAFRKNFPSAGFTYDPDRDAFINPKPIVPPDMEQYVYFDDFACLWIFDPPMPPPLEIGVARVE